MAGGSMGAACQWVTRCEEAIMPGTYRCPKGGSHEWETKKQADGTKYKQCKKCGQVRPA
jgi:hypothetical protein